MARDRRTSPLLDTTVLRPNGIDAGVDGVLAEIRNAVYTAGSATDYSNRALSVGVRWNQRRDMALKLQHDWLRTPSTSQSAYLAARSTTFDNRLRLFSNTLDYVF